MEKILEDNTVKEKALIEKLSVDPEIKKLFAADAGVWEGYTIQAHTLLVFKIFNEQFSKYDDFYHFQFPADIRLFETLQTAVALHDIGKPYAVQAGDKKRQHEFTVPILEKKMQELGFSPREIQLAKALVGHDIMGDYVKGRIDVEKAKARLHLVAQEIGMPLLKFAPLQFLFYSIDASAYPSLRQRIFTKTPEGLLVPNKNEFQNLWQKISIAV